MFTRLVTTSVFFLFTVGCAHNNASAARKYASAPRIENPLLGGAGAPLPGLTTTNEALLFSAFDGQQLCFEGANQQSPGEAMGTRYTLRFLNTDAVDFKTAPSLTTSVVTVLGSSSQLVPVTRVVEDTVRDARGNTIGSVSRQVQEMEPRYETRLRICFAGASQALSAEARFMVLMREAQAGSRVWGIPTGPRSSWVWRFPKADEVSQPVASRN